MMKSDAAGIANTLGYQYHYCTEEFKISFYLFWNTEANLPISEMYPLSSLRCIHYHITCRMSHVLKCGEWCVPMTYSLIPIAALTLQIFIATTT